MKKVIVSLVCFFFAGMTIFAQSKAIAVPVPKTVNMPSELDYVPISIQGIVQSDLRKYGDLKVVDRLNENMIKAEQKLSESVFYSDDDLLQIGNMTKARLVVVGKILYKPATSSFQLNFNINDVEKNEIKATANIDNCSLVAIENGDAIHELSYKLMSEYGIKLTETQKQELTKKSSSSTNNLSIEAQINVAKGMIAAQNGQNVEALTYYMKAKTQDKTFIDADKLMNQMTSVVTGGNFGETAKNLIKLRKDWIKLLEETAKFIADNEPMYDFVYDTYMEIDKIDYENEKLSIKFHYPAVFKEQSEINKKELMEKIIAAYNKIPESKDWGIDIDNFDSVYAGRYWDYNINLGFELLNKDKKVIASKEIIFNTGNYRYRSKESRYDYEPRQTRIKIAYDGKSPYQYEYLTFQTGNWQDVRIKNGGSLLLSVVPKEDISYFILSDIPVENADTSAMYIKYTLNSSRENVSVYSEEQFSKYVEQYKIKHFMVDKFNIDNFMIKIPGKNYRMLCCEVTDRLNNFYDENGIYCSDKPDSFSLDEVFDFCNKLSKEKNLKPVYSIEKEAYNKKTGKVVSEKMANNDKSGNIKWRYVVTVDRSANGYRLPTKDEWIYCFKAGERYKYSGSNELENVAWSDDNRHVVCQKRPNAYGLYDMTGNINELCISHNEDIIKFDGNPGDGNFAEDYVSDLLFGGGGEPRIRSTNYSKSQQQNLLEGMLVPCNAISNPLYRGNTFWCGIRLVQGW